MKFEDIIVMWESDSVIDDDHLDRESTRTPNLHAKYLNLLIQYKLKIVQAQKDYKTLRTKKFRYYRGELSMAELNDLGWEQWQGVKPLKNEMEEFLDGDVDLADSDMKIEYLKSVYQYLDSVMSQLKARDWQIRNSINWKQFISGA